MGRFPARLSDVARRIEGDGAIVRDEKEGTEAAATPPGRDEAYTELLSEGERLLEVGRAEEAEEKLRAAVEANPEDAYVRNKLGVSLARQQRLQEAREQFSAALRIDPRFAPAHSNMGNLYGEEGRDEDAIASYLEALRHDPDYYVAHHNLGAAYRRQGRIADAVSHLKRANRLEKEALRREARERTDGGRWRGVLFWIAVGVIMFLLLRNR